MTILAYHAVDPHWRSPLSVAPALFERHLEWLVRHRRIVPLTEAVARRGARRAVALTFDDGFASVHAHAVPRLLAAGATATVFPIASLLIDRSGGRAVPDVPGSPSTLTVYQIHEMQAAGFTFGSHGFAHTDLTAMSDDELRDDLRRSKGILEDILRATVEVVAYPQGLTDERVWRIARGLGFGRGLAMSRRRRGGGEFEIPRAGVYDSNGVTLLAAKTSSWYLKLRTGGAYERFSGLLPRRDR
jgi:peptidoglycan/xylan/chitin deacetylase (PgdA/CDA1 family)